MTAKPVLQLVIQPQEFFHELVMNALGKNNVKVRPETEFYLVNLLNHFMNTENLYLKDASGNLREEPLVFLLKEAIDEREKRSQELLFRYVGDVSLYVAGFFQESLKRKLVDVGYYIDIGEAAYKSVASRSDELHRRNMFGELAEKFPVFVNLLADVSEKTTPKTEKELIRVYERWLDTGSGRAAQTLVEAGILSKTPAVKTDMKGQAVKKPPKKSVKKIH